MKIGDEVVRPTVPRRLFAELLRRKVLTLLLTGVLLVSLLGGTAAYLVYLGAKLHRDHYIQGVEQMVHYVLDTNFRIPVNFFKGMLAPRPETLVLDIKLRNYHKIAFDRERAFTSGRIPEGEYVPATLTRNDRKYRVEVRLHGKYLDHVASDKWSLRIKIRGEETLFGMKRFNLMGPKTRYGVYEWVSHELSRNEGLIALRTDYVALKINGEHKGIYQLEEVFDKRMIESNQRREGIIFRPIFPIRVHQRDRVLEVSELKSQLALLESLYDRFLAGDLPASKLFDVEKLAKYYAITDLVAGYHQLIPINMHLYFNPITGLLEPIGREWDVHFYRPHTTLAGEITHEFVDNHIHSRTFSDPVIFSRYVQELERMSQPEYLDEFFSKLDPILTEKLNILYKDYPHYSFSKDYLYEGQRLIKKKLTNVNALRAYHRTTESGKFTLLVSNRSRLRLELAGLSAGSISIPDERFPMTIARQPIDGAAEFTNLTMDTTPNPGAPLKVSWRVQGSGAMLESNVLPWPFSRDVPDLDLVRLEPNHEKFPFIRTDAATKSVYFLPGEWNLTESLILPPGHTIYAHAGTTLHLKDSACIVSYSRLEFRGSPEDPIVIRAESGNGECLTVFGAKERSTLEYVHLRGLSNPSSNGWEMPGAITFHESPVDIRSSHFSANARGDDLLNIVRSEFTIAHSTFSRALGDALDVDFGTGTIADSRYVSSGNDAIDVSGSRVEIKNVLLDGIGDKGLSVGEDSRVSVASVTIKNAYLAVASKDESKVEIQDASLSNCKVGFAAYQKKPEFGPATIIASSVTVNDVETPFLIERGSTMSRDRRPIPATMENVADNLYAVASGTNAY